MAAISSTAMLAMQHPHRTEVEVELADLMQAQHRDLQRASLAGRNQFTPAKTTEPAIAALYACLGVSHCSDADKSALQGGCADPNDYVSRHAHERVGVQRMPCRAPQLRQLAHPGSNPQLHGLQVLTTCDQRITS